MVAKISKISVKGAEIVISQINDQDYICLTDMVKGFGDDRTNTVIQNWLRNKDTLEFLGIWERMNNTNFNCIEFDAIKMKAGSNRFTLSPKEWIEKTNAQEAELLNVAVFGYTSKEWAEKNPEKILKGENIRDDADNIQLIALNNAQVLNRELIKSGISQIKRLAIIRSATIDALKSLSGSPTIKRLEKDSKKTNL